MYESIFLKDNPTFETFSLQHLYVVLFFVLGGYLLIAWAKKLPKKQQIKVGNIFGFSLSASVVIWTFLKIYTQGHFNIKEDLPLHLCNFMALLAPVLTLTRKKIYYELLLFWVFAGTSHAIITPDVSNAFPHFKFLKYWFVHAGLIVFVLFATHVYKLRPNIKSVFKSFVALQAYIVLMILLNSFIGANYFYTNHKPEVATALDYLGEWPYYILTVELIMIPYFLIIYLPFHLMQRQRAKY